MKILLATFALAGTMLSCSSDGGDDPAPGSQLICVDLIGPGIMVEVHDAVTGLPAACDATGKAEDGGLVEALSPGADCAVDPTFLYLSGIHRPGTWTVTIERPGYQPWVRDGITVVREGCGLVPVQVRADLQPL